MEGRSPLFLSIKPFLNIWNLIRTKSKEFKRVLMHSSDASQDADSCGPTDSIPAERIPADDDDQVMDLVQMAANYRRYARTPRAMKTKRILQEVVVLVETAVENGMYTMSVARNRLMARLIEDGTDEGTAIKVADQIQLPNVLARGLADRGVRCLASWETVRRKQGGLS